MILREQIVGQKEGLVTQLKSKLDANDEILESQCQ